VTGGGTGIGRAAAQNFAQAGDAVTIIGRRESLLKESAAEMGPNVATAAFDLRDPQAIEDHLHLLPERVDVLVNAAGCNVATRVPVPRTLPELRDLWLGNMEANLMTTVLITSAVLSRISDDGRIIGLGSMAARTGG
jgi:3-oxoacyl-[acyl-carrier protein] reductase